MIEIDAGAGGGGGDFPAPTAAPIEESPEQQFAAAVSAPPPESDFTPFERDRDFAQAIAPDSTPWVAAPIEGSPEAWTAAPQPPPVDDWDARYASYAAPIEGSPEQDAPDDWSRQMAQYQQTEEYGRSQRTHYAADFIRGQERMGGSEQRLADTD